METDTGWIDAYVEVSVSPEGSLVLTEGLDDLTGTAGNDVFVARWNTTTNGDRIDGGGGDADTILLAEGGIFDFTEFAKFSGIESIRGSIGVDTLKIRASQLADVQMIYGGQATDTDFLNITETNIDLQNILVSGFRNIVLQNDGATIILKDKSLALKVDGKKTAYDTLVLTGGATLTAEEIATIHRNGIDVIQVGSNPPDENLAPQVRNLGGYVSRLGSRPVHLDRGQDALISDDGAFFRGLRVILADKQADESFGIDTSGGVKLSRGLEYGSDVLVDGMSIGVIVSSSSSSDDFEIQFSDGLATSDKVQQVVRALTYTKSGDSVTGTRNVSIQLQDDGWRTTSVEIVVDGSPNNAPTALGLSPTVVKEAVKNGTVIGHITASDPDGDPLSYSIVGGSDIFAIKGRELVVAEGCKLDFEQVKSHQITIRVQDPGGAYIENTFTITVQNVDKEVVTGSSGDDVIVGGRGNDKLYGKLGKDTLTGGKGKDIFVFDTKVDKTKANVDLIRDFSVKDDTIHLSKKIFSKIGGKGVLSESAFWIGSKAHDRDDRIIYNPKTGKLLYDADGSGKGAAIEFATLSKNLKTMSHLDFIVI
ncbi:cadherin domain-containing protein [Microvirga flavescens]|uniref:cadherin domain-containing protein n=1 Tax=Microvirga flavescens TaxID=2249811 RepID=UPI0018E0C430|nr:cadherin domain-containing protein [Microvirga flavescens]